MKRNPIRTTLLASLPIILLAVAANAAQIQTVLSVDGAPTGSIVRQCSIHTPVYAIAFATDAFGTPIDQSRGCEISTSSVGTTVSTSGIDVHNGGINGCLGESHHRVEIHQELDGGGDHLLCQGFDVTTGAPASPGWTSCIPGGSVSCPNIQNVTSCTVQPTSGLRIQYSTDGGKHFGSCSNPTMTAASFGQP